jgi:hypothetical protein
MDAPEIKVKIQEDGLSDTSSKRDKATSIVWH